MGKQTVESSLRLDAQYWAREDVRRAAPALVRALADPPARLRAGEGAAGVGLMEMSWTRGRDKSPAGDIRWGLLAEEGGRPRRLLLLFQVTSGGQPYPRRQEVDLDWGTRAGRPCAKPVLLCPFCGGRCRYLCAAYPGRRGGPYLGEFACRACAGLCYAKQLEYKGAWAKSFDAAMGMLAKSRRHPERVTEADFAKVEALARQPLSFGSRLDRLLARLEGEELNKPDGLAEKARLWDVLPPPVFTPPKRRGRPSARRQREQARLCGRIVREAEREARPKRPAGRPKQKRAYDGAKRVEGGCAGRLGPEEGYCVGCRAGRQIAGAAAFTARNGRAGVKGKCAECGRGLCRMGRGGPKTAA